jgi:transaldolase
MPFDLELDDEHWRSAMDLHNRHLSEDHLLEAQAELAALEEAGIHYDQVTRQLQDEGVQKFVDSFRTLFAGIDNKRKVLHR